VPPLRERSLPEEEIENLADVAKEASPSTPPAAAENAEGNGEDTESEPK
jgi:hypothetical protein